jgi:hypothetical protein
MAKKGRSNLGKKYPQATGENHWRRRTKTELLSKGLK